MSSEEVTLDNLKSSGYKRRTEDHKETQIEDNWSKTSETNYIRGARTFLRQLSCLT